MYSVFFEQFHIYKIASTSKRYLNFRAKKKNHEIFWPWFILGAKIQEFENYPPKSNETILVIFKH